jgi:hypothetical protein
MAKSDKQSLAFSIREEDLEELEELASDLRNRVQTHHDNGRLFMMQKYTEMLAGITTDIRKIRARFDRESIASMRKMHKEAKASAPAE